VPEISISRSRPPDGWISRDELVAATGVNDRNLLNLFRDIFPAARCVLLICFLSTTYTPQLAAGIFYLVCRGVRAATDARCGILPGRIGAYDPPAL
jgi:hypothetical protein